MDTDAAAAPASPTADQDVDPIWTSSRTARHIFALGEVEKDIGRLLQLASSAISLLTLPQTDPPESDLPQGEERSEQFVLEVSEYFERLDQVHVNIRSVLAHIRQSRISPAAIVAPSPNFVPPPSGIGTPSLQVEANIAKRGLQEERVARDAWAGVLDAIRRFRTAREEQREKMDADG